MFNLRLDDAVRQLANALILYVRALACQDGDGVMRDHRFHVGDVADGLLERIGTPVVDKTGTPHERQAEGRGGRAHHRLLGGAALDASVGAPLNIHSPKPSSTKPRRAAFRRPKSRISIRPSKGAVGTVEGKKVLLGNAAFMRSQGVDTSAMEAEAERQRGEGATVIKMAADGKLPCIVAIPDHV